MRRLIALALSFLAAPALAQVDYAAKLTEGDFVARDFAFQSGEHLPALRIHYATLGTPRRDSKGNVTNAVMILHGTGGTGRQFLAPQFAQELYGPGQPLDVSRYYIILPDGIGHGKSSKPSDGLRMKFPRYDYADMVEAQRRLLVDGLKVSKLRLLMGTSMGCMHGFIWGEAHPEMVQAMMPLACLPVEIAGLNRMWRQGAINGIKADPAWANGDYTSEPVLGMRTAASLLTVAGGAPLYLQSTYPTRDAAGAYMEERVTASIKSTDANDTIYQIDASRSYNPAAGLERITMPVTWVNSTDDFINPWNLGIAEPAAKRLAKGRFVLLPASAETRGHGTHTWAKFWKQELVDLLARSE